MTELFDNYLPEDHGSEITPSAVLSMMIMNIMVSPKPLYRVEDWGRDYMDGVMEEYGIESAKLNDDRLGRMLDKLFNADRGTMFAVLSARAIKVYELDTTRIHNDTTSVTFFRCLRGTGGRYSKDYPWSQQRSSS